MPKIFIWCVSAPGWRPNDVIGYALAEDGTGLGSHLSSNVNFSKHDMGITSDWKHDTYKAYYPKGYELIWLDEPMQNEEFVKALKINLENAK